MTSGTDDVSQTTAVSTARIEGIMPIRRSLEGGVAPRVDITPRYGCWA